METSTISMLTGLKRNTINSILSALRKNISQLCELESGFDDEVFECGKSYVGARRVRGRRG